MNKNILIASTLLIAATATWLYAASTDRAADRDHGPRPPRPGESCSNSPCVPPQPETSTSTTVTKSKPGDVQIQNGYQTDPRDGGRPVGLIASALEVDGQVFRDAFSEVRPAKGGPPSEASKRANKKVLMDALSPLGVTDERLNEVSNFYRYRPEAGETWTIQAAKINAVIEDHQVTDLVIEDPGFGYLSEPQVSVVGYPDLQVRVALAFDRDLRRNGRIESVELVDETNSPTE